jgi:hypothetical protein
LFIKKISVSGKLRVFRPERKTTSTVLTAYPFGLGGNGCPPVEITNRVQLLAVSYQLDWAVASEVSVVPIAPVRFPESELLLNTNYPRVIGQKRNGDF